MLAGIHQNVFLSEWGFPEVEIALDRMRGIFKPEATFMEALPADENGYRMWIYRERRKVLFFVRGTMVSHLSCSEFKERCKGRREKPRWTCPGNTPAFGGAALSLVA
jgi:hypothetical protein